MKFLSIFFLFVSVLSYPCFISANDFNIEKVNRPNVKKIIDNLHGDNIIPLPLNPQPEEPAYCKQMREDFSKRWGELHEKKWTDLDFVFFFYFGLFNGYKKTVDLTSIGLLDDVKNYKESLRYQYFVAKMIRDYVKKMKGSGNFHLERDLKVQIKNLETDYTELVFSLGHSTLIFYADGVVIPHIRYEDYSGKMKIKFIDRFADPVDVIQFIKKQTQNPGIEKELPDWFLSIANCFGDPYDITGEWEWEFSGRVFRHEKI